MAARWQGYEGWLQDIGAIEQKYCTNDGEDLESHPLDHYVQLWEGNESDNESSDVDDDNVDDDDDESIVSNNYNNDDEEELHSYFQYEQNLLQNLRNIRANYSLISKSRERPSSDILTLNAEDFGHDLIQVRSAKEAIMQINEQKPKVIGVALFHWHMRITSQFSVILDGSKMKDRHEPWHTTIIKERVDNDPRKLKTVTGSVYILQTDINEKAMLQNDLPENFIDQFRHGFPANWETVIKEFGVKFSLMRSSLKDEKLVKSNEKQFEKTASVPMLQDTNTKLMRKKQPSAILDSSTVRQESHKQRPNIQTQESRQSAVVSRCEDRLSKKGEMPSRQKMEILSANHQGECDRSSEQTFDPLQIGTMPEDSRVSSSHNTVSSSQIRKGMSNELLIDVAGVSQNSSQSSVLESRDNISNETPRKGRKPPETKQSSVKRKRKQRLCMPRKRDSGVTRKRFRMSEGKIKSEEEGNQNLHEHVVSKCYEGRLKVEGKMKSEEEGNQNLHEHIISKCYEGKLRGEGKIKSEEESHQSWAEDVLSNTYSYGDKLKSEPGVYDGLATMKRLKIESQGCSNTSDASNESCHEDMINRDMYDGLKAMKKFKIESQIDCSTLETSNTNTQEAVIKKEIHVSDGLATVDRLKIESPNGYNTSGIGNLQIPSTLSRDAGLLHPEPGTLHFHGGSIKVKRKRRNNLRYRPGKNLSKASTCNLSERLSGEKFDVSHRSRGVISNASQTDDGSTQPESSSEEHDEERFVFDQNGVKREIKVEDLAMSQNGSSLRGRKGSHLTKECMSLAKMQPECHDFLTAFDNSPLNFASANDHDIYQCKERSKKLGHAGYQDIWAPLCESRGDRGIPKWDLFDDRKGKDGSDWILKQEEFYVKKEGLFVEQNEPFIKKEELGDKYKVEGHDKQGGRCKEKSFVIIAKEVSGSSDLDIDEDCQIVSVLNRGDRDEASSNRNKGSHGRVLKDQGRKMSFEEGDKNKKRFADEAVSGLETNKEQKGTTTQEQKASEHNRNFKEQDNYHGHVNAQKVENSKEFTSASSRQMIINGAKGNATDKDLPCEGDKQVLVGGNGKDLSKEKDDRERPTSSQVQSYNAAVPSGSSDDLSSLSSDRENGVKSGGKHLDRQEIDSREDSLHRNYSLRSKRHDTDRGYGRLENRGVNELLRNGNKDGDVVTIHSEICPNSRAPEGMILAKKGTVSKQKAVQQKYTTLKAIQEKFCTCSEKGINVTQSKDGPVIDENELSVTKDKQKVNLKARRKAQRAKRENEISQLRSSNEMLSSDICETESARESDATDQGSAQKLTRGKVGLPKDRVKQNLMSENGNINCRTEEVIDTTDQECGQRMTRSIVGLLKDRVEQTSMQNKGIMDHEREVFNNPMDQESVKRIMTSKVALLRDRIETRPERRSLEKRTLNYEKVEVSDATDQESRQIVTRSKVTSLKDRMKHTLRLEKGISNHEAKEGIDTTDQEDADQKMTRSKVALPRNRRKQASKLEKGIRNNERVTVCDTTDEECGKIVTRSMVGLLKGSVTQTSTLEKRTGNYENDSTGKETASRDMNCERMKPRMDTVYERKSRMGTKNGTVGSKTRASNKSLKQSQQSSELEKGTRSNNPETAVNQGKMFIESDCDSAENLDLPMKPIVAIRQVLRKNQEKQEYEKDPHHRRYHPQDPLVERRMLDETDIERSESLPRKSPLATRGLLKSSHIGPGILKTSRKGRGIEGSTKLQSSDVDNQDLNYYHEGARDVSQHRREIEIKNHLEANHPNCKQESRSSEDGRGRKSDVYWEEFSGNEKVGLKRNATTLHQERAYVDDVFSEGIDKTVVRQSVQKQSPIVYPRGRTPHRVHFKEPNEEENDALKRMNPQESCRHPITLIKENSLSSRTVVEEGRKASAHAWTMSSRESEEKKARGSKFRAENSPTKRRTDDEATASADRNHSSRNSIRRNQNIAPSVHIEEGNYTAVRPMSNKAVVDHHMHVLQSRDRKSAIGPAQRGYGQSFVDISTDEEWSDEELEKLKFALSHFHPNRPYFWQKVATFVGTKSSSSCQSQYEELKHPKKAEKIVKQSKKENERAKQIKTDIGASFQEAVTAKRGTLRRKKQVREFLEAQDQGYEDDIFDSTPYRNRSRNITLPFDASRLAAACYFEDASEGDCDQDVNTSSKDSPNDSSIGSTPGFLSPDILRPINRDEADAYMYRLKKKQPLQNAARNSAKKQAKHQKGNQRTYALADVGDIFRKNNDRYDNDDGDHESDQDDYYNDDDDYDNHNQYQRHGYRC